MTAAEPPQPKYDVFLSFRGEDTRHKFTSHLYAVLKMKKICTYMDDKSLERGDEIGPALSTAIEQSKLSIIIFSKHYSSSSWCLNELVHVLKCKRAYRQVVVPVFYETDPSHVRWQKGTYAEAFEVHEQRFKDRMDKVREWRHALTTAACLSGFAQGNRPESELVETIVKDILMKLSRQSSIDLEGYVGIEPHIQKIESLLCMHKQDVHFRTIGIWGIGGIGKTTIADAVFHSLSAQFEACSFVANVRERSQKDGLHHLRNELLRELLHEEGLSIGTPSVGSVSVKERLSRTKVLIVLDDVSDLTHLKFLLGNKVPQFGPGSRVIVTTKNRGILKGIVDDENQYRLMGLDSTDALELFQMKAFKDNSTASEFLDLSRKVVNYANGIPLVLQVLGSTFLQHDCCREMWEEELEKLEKFPNEKIQNVLRLSYDGLEKNEKGIFLDIACYLKGQYICDAKRILEIRGFYPSSGISVLKDMSLVSISRNNRLEMHDLVQEMGRSVVLEEEEPGKRSRLWNKDAYGVLKNNTGTAKIKVMFLEMSRNQALQLSPTAFSNMLRLMLLKVCAPETEDREVSRRYMHTEEQQLITFPLLHGDNRVLSFFAKSNISVRLRKWHNSLCSYVGMNNVFNLDDLPKGFESLPDELRYFHWDKYPWRCLPSKISLSNLVDLHMQGSRVERLWNNGQNLENLKRMNLRDCEHLTQLPDLSRCLNIERIDLSNCGSLDELPSYLKTLVKLTYLNLGYCSKLKNFPEIPCNVDFLRLSGTAVQDIPSPIWSHGSLDILALSNCEHLRNLTTWKLNSYAGPRELHMVECKNLVSLPDSLYSLKHLDRLNLTGCEKLERLPPFSVGSCPLTTINLRGCSSLLEVPDGLVGLSLLQYIDLRETMIESIPASIKNASSLRELYLDNCKKLQSIPELPLLLRVLTADNCTSLKTVAGRSRTAYKPDDVGALRTCPHEILTFTNCFELDERSRNNIVNDAALRIERLSSLYDAADSNIKEFMVILPGNVIPDCFSDQREGCKIDVKFDMDQLDRANFLGFAISAVFGLHKFDDDDDGFSFTCDCSFKTCHGEDYVYSYKLPWVQCTSVDSDQVLLLFNKDTFWREGSNKCGTTPIPLNMVTDASFHFYQEATPYELLKVKKCGIQLLYSLLD